MIVDHNGQLNDVDRLVEEAIFGGFSEMEKLRIECGMDSRQFYSGVADVIGDYIFKIQTGVDGCKNIVGFNIAATTYILSFLQETLSKVMSILNSELNP